MSDAEIMAMSGMADAALQVAGNITASTFNYEHTKELAKWQNEMNIQNWQMANEYNSPINQMERMKAAGLNPNLMYGQGTTGNAGSVAATTASSHNEVKNPFEGVQLAGMYQQLKNAALDADSKLIDNDIKRIRYHKEIVDLQNQERKLAAVDQFAMDHSAGLEVGQLNYRKHNFGSPIGSYSIEQLRHSPEYKNLELLWQKGDLNEKNIGLIGTKTNVLGFSEEKNTLLRNVLQGDVDMKKLITLLLLNLLESSSSPGVLSKIF